VHDDGVDSAVAQEHHVGGEGGLEGVVGHRVAAVLDHDDLAVNLLQPRQRGGEDLSFERRRNGIGFAGDISRCHEL
jgi:hypothetical protein